MPVAPYGPDEDKQRESLHKTGLLDTPLEQRFDRITRMACMILDVPICAFTLIDGERQWFKSIQGMHGTENTRKDSFCAYTIQGSDMMIIEDANKDERFADNPLVVGNPNIVFYAGCPVRAPDGRNIGSLCAIDLKTRKISAEQTQALRDLAEMVEAEVKVAQLSTSQNELITQLDTAQRLALIDPMTRIWNRAGMEEILNREYAVAVRKKTPIALAMCDIDHFKKINDTYGHDVGDTVIIESTKRIVASLRTEDAVARMGGEEFLIVMPGCTPDTLKSTLERIRHAVVDLAIPTDKAPIFSTMSFGGTVKVPTSETDILAMIKTADEALYRAKTSGRNRTEINF